MKRFISVLLLTLTIGSATAQDSIIFRQISDEIMLHGTCYDNLRVLCKQIGHRLSGSLASYKAIEWGQKALTDAGADKVWLQPTNVPRWVRGKEHLKIRAGKAKNFTEVTMLSLGNSIGTNGKVLEAPVLMVKNIDAFNKLSNDEVKGKIVFFDYRFRQDIINTFEGYGDAVKYRWMTPSLAASKGAIAVIIRSISTGADDVPHTGSMHYVDTIKKIPAVAIGNWSADKLERECMAGDVTAQIQNECGMVDTVHSYNVIGEVRGIEHPEKVIVVGGHLDSWDVGEGAHDDGAGCVQSIEVIRTFKSLGIRPNYTIRAVLFMNEENGTRGGAAYADSAAHSKEQHVLAIETDAGGFSPRGIGLEMNEDKKEQIRSFRKLFLPYGFYDFEKEEGGADIGYLKKQGVPLAGLLPDPQRYFDLHHTNSDVFEAVNHRELKLGAVGLAQLIYITDKYGL